MSEMNPKVDSFITKADKWQDAYKKLREIVLNSQLKEDFKWGVPCYTLNDSNVVLIHGFKEYCAILFVKGALLTDTDHVLIQQTENVQAARQMRFTNIEEIELAVPIIKKYIDEATEIEKAGLKVVLKKETELTYPEEFQVKMNENPELKIAFEKLTPGRQRAYNLYFSAPKQSKTRASRVENYLKKILDGKGLND